mgnify:CR=1 FL=1|jgi:hypothetical protein
MYNKPIRASKSGGRKIIKVKNRCVVPLTRDGNRQNSYGHRADSPKI